MFENYYWSLIAGVPIVGTVLGYFSKPKEELMEPVKTISPPRAVVYVAWPLLYTMFGFAWSFALEDPPCDYRVAPDDYIAWTAYSTTLAVLYSKSFIFNESPSSSLYVHLLASAGTLMCYSTSPMASKLLLSPLMIWLNFAGMLNYTIAMTSRI